MSQQHKGNCSSQGFPIPNAKGMVHVSIVSNKSQMDAIGGRITRNAMASLSLIINLPSTIGGMRFKTVRISFTLIYVRRTCS